MKISLKRIDIEDNPANEVTTHKLFKNRNVFDEDGNLLFHKDGIFSERIFGKFGKCKCGALTEPGICKICETRVLDKKHIPNFYIKFDSLDIPYINLDTTPYPKYKNELKGLFNYSGFLYKGDYFEYNLDKLDLSSFDEKDIKIGKEAILSLGVDEEWYNSQITNKVYIPHTSLRKITVQNGEYFLGSLNVLLLDVLKKKNKLKKFEKLATNDVFSELSIKKELLETINLMYNEIYQLISKGKKSIIYREVKGQGITGAARAVVTNNFNLDEDTVIIGYYFIPTLYPHLYTKYTTEDGYMDVDAINEELKDYLILINRQPTIGEKSIMAFHPVFSKKEEEKYVVQVNPLICSGLAGDFDGDVLLMISLYTEEACEEAKKLLPSRNFIGGADGKIRNGLWEDLSYVMQKTYEDDKSEDIHKIISRNEK